MACKVACRPVTSLKADQPPSKASGPAEEGGSKFQVRLPRVGQDSGMGRPGRPSPSGPDPLDFQDRALGTRVEALRHQFELQAAHHGATGKKASRIAWARSNCSTSAWVTGGASPAVATSRQGRWVVST